MLTIFSVSWQLCYWLRAYPRSLLFFVVDSVCLFVCMSATLLLQIDSSFLFLGGIEPFFGRQFSMWHSTKLFSSIFDLGSLAPKIYSPKFYSPLFTGAAPRQTGRHIRVWWQQRAICAHKDLHVGPIFVAMATTFALGTESNRLPACKVFFVIVSVFDSCICCGRVCHKAFMLKVLKTEWWEYCTFFAWEKQFWC